MTQAEVINAIKNGEVVHWNSPSYTVMYNGARLYLLYLTGKAIGFEALDFDGNLYVEDGAPECTTYKNAFLEYDCLTEKWYGVAFDEEKNAHRWEADSLADIKHLINMDDIHAGTHGSQTEKDGTPNHITYKEQCLSFDAVSRKWSAGDLGEYPTLEEAKDEIDCWLASIEMRDAEKEFYEDEEGDI